jgi:hypothetical protein
LPFSPLLSVGIFDEPSITGNEFIFMEGFCDHDFFFTILWLSFYGGSGEHNVAICSRYGHCHYQL